MSVGNTSTPRFFTQRVDKRSRQEMADYLQNHFRYDTMNSWNRSTSYACNMKIHSFGLDSGTEDRLYELIQVPEFYDLLNYLIQEFSEQNSYLWQAGWNGRSGGYLVLYQGGRKPSGYHSYCTNCGQKNYRSVKETGARCGRCQEEARVDFNMPPMEVFTYPGRGTDMDEDFQDWTLHELRQRTELVQAFDRLADDIVARALDIANEYSVQEQVVYIPQRKMVLI